MAISSSNNVNALVDDSSSTETTSKQQGKQEQRLLKKVAAVVDSDSSTCAESSCSESSASTSTSSSGQGRAKRRGRQSSRRKANNKNNNGRKRTSKRKVAAEQQQSVLTFEEQSQYVAMDCEMVGVGLGGHRSVVARVTMIDWNGKILLDEYVKPSREITDYRTFVSGITPQHLETKAKMDLDECRQKVSSILCGEKILVGHALKNDLHALNIKHPWYQIRDTAKYEPFMKVRFDDGILWPRKLKELVDEKLHRKIQKPGQPHSAYEDALAALDLYRSVRCKWEKAMQYKINKTNEIQQRQQQQLQLQNQEEQRQQQLQEQEQRQQLQNQQEQRKQQLQEQEQVKTE